MTTSLSARLRAETKDAHTAAERSGVMAKVLRGTIGRPAYLEFLKNLAAIYRELEAQLDQHSVHPALAGIDLQALRRYPALLEDIDSLGGQRSDGPAICPATEAYVERLQHLGANEPGLLLAHAYVRYMGDLSGGQILGGIIARTLQLEEGSGTAFFRFALVTDPVAFKNAFRAAVDDAASAVAPDALVHEAQLGFALHEQLFNELA